MWILSMETVEKCLEADKTFCPICLFHFYLFYIFWILSTNVVSLHVTILTKPCLVFNHKMCPCFKMRVGSVYCGFYKMKHDEYTSVF